MQKTTRGPDLAQRVEGRVGTSAPRVDGAPKVLGSFALRHVHIVHGDPDAPADVWVEGYYELGTQDQAPLGPEAGLAIPARDGGIDLYVST